MFELLGLPGGRLPEQTVAKVMEMSRADATMIKLWRRAVPRKVHVQGGVYMKQAVFALKIQKEIQPLWDTLPESKETTQFRKMMVHFIVKKTGTQREKMLKRRWNEGLETTTDQKESSGPHAMLTYVDVTTQNEKNKGKDKRVEKEKREQEYRRLHEEME